ncbi:hypothetical protein ACFVS2_20835 [Brevibacillus sp. NPDC058079]|uniref:hypothetical protein n=1 Tax=Brevibacillus sp. NPDC058079 TaxID=3346330 RepID=UPI0036EB5C91
MNGIRRSADEPDNVKLDKIELDSVQEAFHIINATVDRHTKSRKLQQLLGIYERLA